MPFHLQYTENHVLGHWKLRFCNIRVCIFIHCVYIVYTGLSSAVVGIQNTVAIRKTGWFFQRNGNRIFIRQGLNCCLFVSCFDPTSKAREPYWGQWFVLKRKTVDSRLYYLADVERIQKTGNIFSLSRQVALTIIRQLLFTWVLCTKLPVTDSKVEDIVILACLFCVFMWKTQFLNIPLYVWTRPQSAWKWVSLSDEVKL